MTRPAYGPRERGRGTDHELLSRPDAGFGITDQQSDRAQTGQPGPGGTPATGSRSRTAPTDQTGPTYETGTTIVALAADDAVVVATDQRMSLGGRFTANKDVRKVEQVHPTAALAISGSVGPAQGLVQSLRAEASLYESRRDEPMSMTALSQTAGQLVRGLPVTPLLGGVDETGGHVYELDGGGSVLEDRYAAGGSGMQVAYGVLERRVDGPVELEDATETATAAVEAASERDTASGDGVTVATITTDGVEITDVGESGGQVTDGDSGTEVA